ncbi:MAG: hypothetical protein ACE5G7_06720 [Candidatus Hydrothermarchaeaceae archaeon]
MKMRILGKFEVIEPYAAVFIRDIDSIAFSDLHLGYEGIMAENGVFLPRVQFEKEVEVVKGILEKQRAKRVIINGDIKHEFSETSYHEYKEDSGILGLKSFQDHLVCCLLRVSMTFPRYVLPHPQHTTS